MSSPKLKKPGAATALAALLAALAPVSASAAVLYAQLPQDGGSAWQSNSGVGLWNGDTFVLGGDSQLQGISWWGTAAADGFVVRLFDALTGGTAPSFTYSGTVNSELADPAIHDEVQSPIYRYWIDGLSFGLGGGTPYLLSIDHEQEEWYWLASAAGDGVSYFRGDENDGWDQVDPDLAFAIDGQQAPTPVPEPGTLALLGLAGLSAALGTRRRRMPA